MSDLDRLRPLEPSDVPYLTQAVSALVPELGATPLIGFAGAPFTLASYLIEGGPSREHARTKALMHGEPALWHALLARLATISRDLSAACRSTPGAAAVQLFDSWAGALSRRRLRAVRAAAQPSRAGIARWAWRARASTSAWAPASCWRSMRTAGADVVGVDWRVPLTEAARRLGPGAVVQGNLDPALLLADWPVIDAAVRRIVAEGRGAAGHIFNLGHGVLPETDPDVLTRVVELVHGADGLTWMSWSSAAGIAGLAAAWTVCDRAARGGRDACSKRRRRSAASCASRRSPAQPVDVGAEAMLARRPEALELARAAGLGDDLVDAVTTSASVCAGGALHPLPARTMMGVPSDVAAARASGVLSAGVGWRRSRPSRRCPRCRRWPRTSASVRWCGTRLGDEVVDRLVEPLLGGVYAGRADELSLRAAMPALAARLHDGGSLVAAARGRRRRQHAPPVRPGLRGAAPAGSAGCRRRSPRPGGFTVRTGVTVRAIRRTPTGFALECGPVPRAGAHRRRRGDRRRAAGQGGAAAARGGARRAAAELAAIETASVAIVTLAFRDVRPAAGQRAARRRPGSGLAVKGVTLSSQKWPRVAAAAWRCCARSIGRAGETRAAAALRRRAGRAGASRAAPRCSASTADAGRRAGHALGRRAAAVRGRPRRPGRAHPARPSPRCPAWRCAAPRTTGVGIPACIGSRSRSGRPGLRSARRSRDNEAMVDGKKARELNDVIRYTALVGVPGGPPLGDGDRPRSRPRSTSCSSSSPPRTSTVRGTYDVCALRADADLMVWWHAPTADALQDAYSPASAAPRLGAHLEPVWSVMALHRPAEFNKQPHPGLPGRGGAAALRVRLPVRPLVRVVPAARGASAGRCWPSTASWPATTRTCGRTRSPRSRSATTSGSWPSRPTSCTASSISCGTCDRPRPGGTFAKRCRSTPAPGAASPRSSRCFRSGCRPVRSARVDLHVILHPA